MVAGSLQLGRRCSTRREWAVSYGGIRYWTKYEIKEVRYRGLSLGYVVILRRTAITDNCDCGFSFEETGVVPHDVPFTASQLTETRSDGYPKYVNCHSTLERALDAAALHSLGSVNNE